MSKRIKQTQRGRGRRGRGILARRVAVYRDPVGEEFEDFLIAGGIGSGLASLGGPKKV
jgi:hypothetical protein